MFGLGRSVLQKALARGQSGKSTYRDELLGKNLQPRGPADVAALRAAFVQWPIAEDGTALGSDLSVLLGVVQNVDDRETALLVRDQVVPVLLGIADEVLTRRLALGPDMAMLAKILAMFPTAEAITCIVRLVGAYPSEFLWSVVFCTFSDDHPFTDRLLAALSSTLPPDFAGVALLDFANIRALAGKLHVFDSEEGIARIEDWLSSPDPAEDSYAHSATAALAFISEASVERLIEVALSHRSRRVRLEAAWAAARRGQTRGLELLSQACQEVQFSSAARQYLDELGRPELIPAVCTEPTFVACAEMSEWLAHPSELGRVPQSVELAASWDLFWPPTGDRRRLFVIRYEADKDDAGPDVGFGLVGSITFALFGEATADLRPLEVLALHCCWELEQEDRFRGERSVKAGLQLLLRDNPDLASELPS